MATDFESSVGALRRAAECKDWARLALEIGNVCGVQGQEALSKLLQAVRKAADNPRSMQKAKEQQKIALRRQIHSELTSAQPVLPIGGPKLNSDSTTAVLVNCGYRELSHLACVSRGSLSAVYSPAVQSGRIIHLMRNTKIKKTDDLLHILASGGRWQRAKGLVLPMNMTMRLNAWGNIAGEVPGLVHLDISGLRCNSQSFELIATIVKHFPYLRTFRGVCAHVDLSEEDNLLILDQLGCLTSLEELDLETNLFPAHIEALYTMLKALEKLRSFDLRSFNEFPIAVLRRLLQFDKIQYLGVEILEFDPGEYTVQSLIQALQPSKVRKLQTHDLDLSKSDWGRIKTAASHLSIHVFQLDNE